MSVLLLHSAMMPAGDGTYVSETIDLETFVREVKKAYDAGILKSYVGYPQNIPMLEKVCGVPIEENREEITINDGDMMLIVSLKYKVSHDKKRRLYPRIEDFELRRVYYTAEPLRFIRDIDE